MWLCNVRSQVLITENKQKPTSRQPARMPKINNVLQNVPKDWLRHLAFKVQLRQYYSGTFWDINHKLCISLVVHYAKHLPRSTLTCMDGSILKLSAFLPPLLFHGTRARILCKCWGSICHLWWGSWNCCHCCSFLSLRLKEVRLLCVLFIHCLEVTVSGREGYSIEVHFFCSCFRIVGQEVKLHVIFTGNNYSSVKAKLRKIWVRILI